MASFACFSVNGFPSILLEAYELFFFEFFLSLFFVTGGSSIVLREKRFSSISDIFFKISFVSITFIKLSTSISSIYIISIHELIFHYNYTIFSLFFTSLSSSVPPSQAFVINIE